MHYRVRLRELKAYVRSRFKKITKLPLSPSQTRRFLAACTENKRINSSEKAGAIQGMAIIDVIKLAIREYQHEFPELEKWLVERGNLDMFPSMGQYDWQEAHVLYSLIRLIKPRMIFEISPNHGFSTGIILQALNKNQIGYCASFELLGGALQQVRANLEKFSINSNRLIWLKGDCWRWIEHLKKQTTFSIDMLFIDSEHTFEFAKYTQQIIFPLVRENGLIHFHDVSPDADDNLPYSVWPDVNSEAVFLTEYIKREKIDQKRYIYGKALMKMAQTDPALKALNDTKPHYKYNFEPLSKERNYNFWLTK